MDSAYLPALEAVIFAGGEPISIEKITEAMELEQDLVLQLIEQLTEKLNREDSGIRLVKMEEYYQLCTKSQYADYVRRAFEIRRNTPLSQAALEVLAVVSYNQPVTKAFIEQVRGVDCSGVLASLGEKGLVEEKGRLDLPGRPLLYGTTPVFLRCFGLTSLEELPSLPEVSETEQQQDPADSVTEGADPQEPEVKKLSDILKEAAESKNSVISDEKIVNTMDNS